MIDVKLGRNVAPSSFVIHCKESLLNCTGQRIRVNSVSTPQPAVSHCCSLSAPVLSCSSELGTEISPAEAKEAIRILDSSSTGYIQFADFVEWYLGSKPSQEAKDAASTQSV